MYFLLVCVMFTIPPEFPPEFGPLSCIEKIDQPVAASFYSFSGTRDAPPIISSSIIRQFGLNGGGSMRGITIPSILLPTGTPQTAIGASLRRQFGITAVVTNTR